LSASKFLNPKQKRFCQVLEICGNQTQAAKEAGYSARTAGSIAARLMTNVNVQKYIEELRIKRQKSTGVTADKVLKEFAKIGFANIPAEAYKASDKVKALEKLGAHLGLFSDLNTALATLSLYGELELMEDGSYVFRPAGSGKATNASDKDKVSEGSEDDS
jgi:phage terminase small subunit